MSISTLLLLIFILGFLKVRRKTPFSWQKYLVFASICLAAYAVLLYKVHSLRKLSDMDSPPHKVYNVIVTAKNDDIKKRLFLKHGALMSTNMQNELKQLLRM